MIKIKISITKMKTLKIKINDVNFKGSGEKRWIGSDTSNTFPAKLHPKQEKNAMKIPIT